jgi:NAD(P)-dependent dehydrogenase (short-subunit alcohol dehydrogenase family)
MPDYAARFSLQGRRALVTGASRGIGAEIAAVLADAGADVAIVGRDETGLEATKRAVADKGRRCVVIEADLRTAEGPRAAGRKALESFGTVDVLVNNAGVFPRATLLEATLEDWEETQAVNLRAPFLLAQVIAPAMIAQRRGKVINISSLAAQVGCEGHAAYSASKGGLNMLTRVMAAEWGPFNIQTNAVAPTVVLTDMGKQAWGDEAKAAPVKARIPLRRFGEPLEIADLVLFLASPASDFICGEVILIDGGYAAV